MHKVLYFVLGVVTGICVDEFFLKDIKKKEAKEDDRVMTKSSEEKFTFTEEEVNDAVKRAEDIMNEEGYSNKENEDKEASEEQDEDEDDEEEELSENIDYDKRYKEFLEKKADLIEKIEYEDAFSGYVDEFDVYDDYGSPMDLYWFPDSMILTDGEGVILKPVEKYMGDLKFTQDEEELFVRNNLIKNRYIIHNEENCTPDEFWG